MLAYEPPNVRPIARYMHIITLSLSLALSKHIRKKDDKFNAAHSLANEF